MSESEYSESDSGERSGATGQGKTPLRKDEVIIVQEKLEQWMAADATKRKSHHPASPSSPNIRCRRL